MALDTIRNFSLTNDATVVQFVPFNPHLEFVFDLGNFLRRRNKFTCMDEDAPAKSRAPFAVFNVFDPGTNEPSPRLTNRNNFHGKVCNINCLTSQPADLNIRG